MQGKVTTKVQVSGLRLRGFHGVGEQEQRVGNIFVYDVELVYPWLEAAAEDNVALTVSYADVVEVVKRVNTAPSRLLENIALRLKESLVATFSDITGGKICVSKLTPPIPNSEMDSAAVVLEW